MSWGDYLHKAQVEERVCVYFYFVGLFMLLCVLTGPTQYIFHMPMARYSLYVLKVPLNTNKTNKQTIPFSDLILLCGWQEAFCPVKTSVLVCWWWRFDWSVAHLIAPVVTTTSIILCMDKIQNWDILVLANPGPPGKWPFKWREREPIWN